MPSPASGARRFQPAKNVSSPLCAAPRRAASAPAAEALAGLIAQLSGGSPAGDKGVSIVNLAASLRWLATLLETAAGHTAEDSAVTAAASEFKATGKLSLGAETLLSVLVAHRRSVERTAPDHAWQTKNQWFPRARMLPERKDAGALIDELIQADFIDERWQGEKGRWHQYRATRAGAQYVASLDPKGIFRRTSE